MRCYFRYFGFACLLLLPQAGQAEPDEHSPILITSPDQATTYAYGNIKSHQLFWDKKDRQLVARIVFVDSSPNDEQESEDAHDFRLPGISLDAAKGIFYATSAGNEIIPVARYRKELFLTVIEALPNAVVRVRHPRGEVTVVLEALRPDDPSLKGPAATQGSRSVDLPSLFH